MCMYCTAVAVATCRPPARTEVLRHGSGAEQQRRVAAGGRRAAASGCTLAEASGGSTRDTACGGGTRAAACGGSCCGGGTGAVNGLQFGHDGKEAGQSPAISRGLPRWFELRLEPRRAGARPADVGERERDEQRRSRCGAQMDGERRAD